MNLKHRTKPNTPGYYLPLPHTLAAHRSISSLDASRWLYNGMLLHLRKFEAPSEAIAVMAYFDGDYRIIGFIPQGLICRLEEILKYEEQIMVSLESRNCSVLKDSFWITIEELPTFSELGIHV